MQQLRNPFPELELEWVGSGVLKSHDFGKRRRAGEVNNAESAQPTSDRDCAKGDELHRKRSTTFQ